MRFCFNGRINPNLRELKIRSAKQTKKMKKEIMFILFLFRAESHISGILSS